ncbi:MAG: hypothetical protein WBR21_08145 [Rouxiella badensis]|uniref:hypothetical protein n=1 Tax=Rouxiella badensis TaxID=1646377 RepID=UPI003C58308F
MICFFDACRKPILPIEWEQHAEWHLVLAEGEETEVVFGKDMAAGRLDQVPEGSRFIKAAHHKCAFAALRREKLEAKREDLLDARRADPLAQPGVHSDWRDQETAGVEVLAGEGNRTDRGS